jgi:flagellar secretion chaperone FliS
LESAHETYLMDRILSASPVELASLLFDAGIRAVRDAREQLARGEIAERARSITRACEILMELAGSLDYVRGGDISRRLGQLYGYMNGRLLEANMQQSDAPLAEVLGLLATLAEGWDGVKAAMAEPVPVATASPWAAAVPPEQAGHAWSF